MIKKILVANRGEIAMRIFRTCRVMNISTVAVYTHVDRGALHVRYAEEAYCISESPEDTSYLKPELILSIAKKTGAAIHPGYGFLSENADFARRCEEEGVIFIGPSADIISKMGIKTEARKIMREAGLPIVPGTETPVQGIDEVKKVANEVGYPIMLKALAGGGGKGMRLGNEDSKVVSYPVSSNVFKVAGGGANYVHGGSSPQEMLVPVLEFKMERGHMETKNAEIALVSIVHKITNLITSMDFIQSDAVSDTVKAAKYRIFFLSEDNEKISNENSYVADSREENAQKRIFRMRFTFKNKKYDKDKQYYLVVYEDRKSVV